MSILLLSGGLDSLVLLAKECSEGKQPICLSFDYGQRHIRELLSGDLIAKRYQVERHVCKIPESVLAGTPLTREGDIPKGSNYDDPIQLLTVVPNRNMLMLSIAGAFAVRNKVKSIIYAAHEGDAAIYPDCRKIFVEAVSRAMFLSCGVTVESPFISMTKKDIVGLGKQLLVPFELSWSCYEGGHSPCGECGACKERIEAGV